MRSRPGKDGRSKIVRHLSAAGLALTAGNTFGIFTLGGRGGAQTGFAPPLGGQLPEHVKERLRECSKRGPAPSGPENHTVSFDVFMDPDGQVDGGALRASTLHLDEVEACMESALRRVSDRPMEASLRRRKPASSAPNRRV
jgi:hypothetical protein